MTPDDNTWYFLRIDRRRQRVCHDPQDALNAVFISYVLLEDNESTLLKINEGRLGVRQQRLVGSSSLTIKSTITSLKSLSYFL